MKKLSICILALMLGTITLKAQESIEWHHYISPTYGFSTNPYSGNYALNHNVGLDYTAMMHYQENGTFVGFGIVGYLSTFPQLDKDFTTGIGYALRLGACEQTMVPMVYGEIRTGFGYNFGINNMVSKMYAGLGMDVKISRHLALVTRFGLVVTEGARSRNTPTTQQVVVAGDGTGAEVAVGLRF